MKKNSVSIIIPIYNSEKVINKCIDSVLNQTYDNFEIIAINDGSKDNTLSILKNYSKKYNNIIVIDKENGGQAAARNDGIKVAKGEYLMFIDADDFIEPNYLEIMVNKALETDADICISGYKNFDNNYKFVSEVKYKDCFWTRFVTCVVWGKIFKSQFIKKYNFQFPTLKLGEDNCFSISAISYTDKVTVVDNSGYGYYYSPNGLTKFTYKGFSLNILSAEQYVHDNINPAFAKKYEKEMWYFYIRDCIHYILWSGKCESKEKFVDKNKEIFEWIEKNVEYYKKHKVTSIFYPYGEKFNVKIILFIYTLLNKLNMINLFAAIFCNKKCK